MAPYGSSFPDAPYDQPNPPPATTGTAWLAPGNYDNSNILEERPLDFERGAVEYDNTTFGVEA
jgi:hypothetical protein